MSRKAKIVSGVAGALTMFIAGIAVAAILLQTSITGQASVIQGGPGSGTANEVRVSVDSTNGSQLNCDDIGISADFTELTFNPKLTVPQHGPNAANTPVPGGSCTIQITVKNTGSDPIRISPQSGVTSFPAGWTPSNLNVPTGAIAPGAEHVLSATVTANHNAQSGPITGKLIYTS